MNWASSRNQRSRRFQAGQEEGRTHLSSAQRCGHLRQVSLCKPTAVFELIPGTARSVQHALSPRADSSAMQAEWVGMKMPS